MRQIIAMGGGGFSMESDNPLLDQYVLNQSKSVRPKVCFVPTASGDAKGYIVAFHFIGTELSSVVSSRPNARGYRLRMDSSGVVEKELFPKYLGTNED